MSADAGLDIGRRVKARRIAEAIRKLGGGAREARGLSEGEWAMADAVSRTKACRVCLLGGQAKCVLCKGTGRLPGDMTRAPSEVTRALVIEYLSRPEAPEVEQCPPRDEDVPC